MPKMIDQAEKDRNKHIAQLLVKNNHSQTAVAKELGISRVAVHQRAKKPAVKRLVQVIVNRNLKRANISAQRVYGQLSRQLDAKRVISANIVRTKSDDPSVEDELATTATKDFIEVDDWMAQDKARDRALELMGHTKKDEEQDKPEQHIHFHKYDFKAMDEQSLIDLLMGRLKE